MHTARQGETLARPNALRDDDRNIPLLTSGHLHALEIKKMLLAGFEVCDVNSADDLPPLDDVTRVDGSRCPCVRLRILLSIRGASFADDDDGCADSGDRAGHEVSSINVVLIFRRHGGRLSSGGSSLPIVRWRSILGIETISRRPTASASYLKAPSSWRFNGIVGIFLWGKRGYLRLNGNDAYDSAWCDLDRELDARPRLLRGADRARDVRLSEASFGRPGADHSPPAQELRNRNAQADSSSPRLTLSKAPSGQSLYHRSPRLPSLSVEVRTAPGRPVYRIEAR